LVVVLDAQSGEELTSLPIMGSVTSIDVHPTRRFVAVGDSGSNNGGAPSHVYLMDLVDVPVED
jgi:hypothetical protein